MLHRNTFGKTHPLDLVALLESFSKLVHDLVSQGTLCLEPHTLHLIQVFNCRHPLLKETQASNFVSQSITRISGLLSAPECTITIQLKYKFEDIFKIL